MYPYNLNNQEIYKNSLNFKDEDFRGNEDSCNKNFKEGFSKDFENFNEEIFLDEYILELVKEGILDKSISIKYYKYLSKLTEDFEEEKILRKIYLDEKKHLKILQEIYYMLTEENLKIEFKEPIFEGDLLVNYPNSIFSKLENVEFYRKLLFSFLNIQIRDWLYEIITDEQSNSQKIQYLYSNLLQKE